VVALRAAATLGPSFALADLRAVSPLDEIALLGALEAAVGADLLRHEGRERFIFTHELIRATLAGRDGALRI
jgi:hypothetical protein